MPESERDYLAGYHKELPIIIEGSESMAEYILNKGGRSMGELNLVVQSLPPEGKKALEQALWRLIEITSRQGVLPLIVEVDRSGNPIERSEN